MAPPNLQTLKFLDTQFSAAFRQGLEMATEDYLRLATVIPSQTATNTYAWMHSFPRMREWIGDREVQGLDNAEAYVLENKEWELTIGIPRKAIEDDQFGMYLPVAQEMGFEAKTHKTELVMNLLNNGQEAANKCYDGKPFFSTTHQVKGANVSNYTAGANPAWYLLATKRPLKPLIFQNRREVELVSKNSTNDDNVFWEKLAVWGQDGRYVGGYGFWQLAYKSKAELTEENLAAARAAMRKLTDDKGRKLNIRPDLLVVGPDLETKAKKIIHLQTIATGGENVMRNEFELMVSNFID